ncbi:unannotated protein [freshwater metagenome]|jgi:hypothetical protein|uniref:Unannotated protein n=1 Tax=freshwater metagenome TaxID=449393 RepID=A0A6J7IV16_9ZZZZ|nr:hypothetical protein [Actinomycetota bacterium]
MSGAPAPHDADDVEDDDPQPMTLARAAGLVAALLLGTLAFFWLATVIVVVWEARPSNPDGPMMSLAAATAQAAIGVLGAFTSFWCAVIVGDRATGGSGPWWRRAQAAWTAGLLVAWILLVVIAP